MNLSGRSTQAVCVSVRLVPVQTARQRCRLVTAVLGLAFAATTAAGAPASFSKAALGKAAEQYRRYALRQIEDSLAGAKALRAAIAANQLPAAQDAWRAARGGWERSEVITGEFFPELNDAIDSWPNAATGFHAIEAKLFGAHRTDILPLADTLVEKLSELQAQLATATLSPQGLLNGATRLSYEAGESKVNGGESQFSGSSLDDMRNNVVGIDAAYRTVFAAALGAHNPQLAAAARKDIEQLHALVQVPDLKSVDPARLRRVSEDLAALLQSAAAQIGLERPALQD